jgi:hypothetical protein
MPKRNVAATGTLDPNHDIDLSGGKFCQTNATELSQAFAKFVDSGSTHLCVFFHGGLVSRAQGLKSAASLIKGYTEAGAYPFFFIWNSDLLTVIKEKLKHYEDDAAYVDAANLSAKTVARKVAETLGPKLAGAGIPRGFQILGPRLDLRTLAKAVKPYDRAWSRSVGLQLSVTQPELDAFEDALQRIDRVRGRRQGMFAIGRIRGARNPLGRVIQRLNSGHGHGIFTTVIEELYIAIGVADDFAKPLWDEMKLDIDQAFTDDDLAGGSAFLEELRRAWDQIPNLRVTVIGHSAGSIYVQRFIEALDAATWSQSKHTVEVITLAAAVSFERMVTGLLALQRRVAVIRVFGMNNFREGNYWEVPFIYNKSLLYIVCSLCEADPEADRPLLGMQRYWSGSRPYDQPFIKAITEFIGARQAVWSPTSAAAAPGYRSNAARHGGFPEEDLTNKSVCYALRNGVRWPSEGRKGK